jgi:adenine phosphoribosyltransferase
MKDYLHLIDTHTRGPRCDVTPLFADAAAFAALVSDLVAPFDAVEIDLVAGSDALGFILGTAIAIRLGRGFIPIRKGGKLPVQADMLNFVGLHRPVEIARTAGRCCSAWGENPAGGRMD